MALVRWAMVVDLRRCTGCHSCSIACKAEHEVPLGVWKTWVKTVEKGVYPNVSKLFLPWMCNHCERPICNTVCPVYAAYRREDGIVLVDPHRCIGCNYCRAACPYDARYVHPVTGMIEKCDFCVHRVDAGLQPACVESCPTEALIFGNIRDPNSRISQVLNRNRVVVLKQQMATYPHVFYINLDMDVADPLMGYEECVSCYELRSGPTAERLKRSFFPWK